MLWHLTNTWQCSNKKQRLDKEDVNKVRGFKAKEREEKGSRRFQKTFTPAKQVVQMIIEKEHKTKSNKMWSTTTIKVANECFHNNFRVGFWNHPLGYRRCGLGITFA